LQTNLPHAPVHDLTIQPHFNDLVVATYGRGFWIMDDITPLQQLTDEVRGSNVRLFTPRDAYRFLSVESAASGNDPAAGRNPQGGASISYWLSDAAAGPAGGAGGAGGAAGAGTAQGAAADPGIPGNSGARADEMAGARGPRRTSVTLEILDAEGQVVRTLRNQPASPGINRANWNLRYESSDRATMRTKPLDHPHVELTENGTRAPGDGGTVTPLAPPGRYTVRLKVGSRDAQEQTLIVLKDPSSKGSDADIAAQFAMQLELRANQNDVAAVINEAERVRAQLRDLRGLLSGRADSAEINGQITAIDEKIIELEMNLTDLRLVGGQDTLRYPRQLYAKISSLAGYISGHDYAPTEAHRAVHEMYKENLGTYQQQINAIRDTDLAAFNRMLRDKGIGTVISGKEAGR
jgi:hypothetical protein